jgi:hypothetical protein
MWPGRPKLSCKSFFVTMVYNDHWLSIAKIQGSRINFGIDYLQIWLNRACMDKYQSIDHQRTEINCQLTVTLSICRCCRSLEPEGRTFTDSYETRKIYEFPYSYVRWSLMSRCMGDNCDCTSVSGRSILRSLELVWRYFWVKLTNCLWFMIALWSW